MRVKLRGFLSIYRLSSPCLGAVAFQPDYVQSTSLGYLPELRGYKGSVKLSAPRKEEFSSYLSVKVVMKVQKK